MTKSEQDSRWGSDKGFRTASAAVCARMGNINQAGCPVQPGIFKRPLDKRGRCFIGRLQLEPVSLDGSDLAQSQPSGKAAGASEVLFDRFDCNRADFELRDLGHCIEVIRSQDIDFARMKR